MPTVYVKNNRGENLDPADPIQVSYEKKIGGWPTGRENSEQLKFGAEDQHSVTITHGVSRNGFMTGGNAAPWKDAELGDRFTADALEFIESRNAKPFFLFFALHQPHVPRVPAPTLCRENPTRSEGERDRPTRRPCWSRNRKN